ncbi:hypothetical protein BJ912DRAFT_958494 [Pholiota molesta]|nr:hypothetical protein BJ912DRAFT_958494 [Pholiota molesta]
MSALVYIDAGPPPAHPHIPPDTVVLYIVDYLCVDNQPRLSSDAFSPEQDDAQQCRSGYAPAMAAHAYLRRDTAKLLGTLEAPHPSLSLYGPEGCRKVPMTACMAEPCEMNLFPPATSALWAGSKDRDHGCSQSLQPSHQRCSTTLHLHTQNTSIICLPATFSKHECIFQPPGRCLSMTLWTMNPSVNLKPSLIRSELTPPIGNLFSLLFMNGKG